MKAFRNQVNPNCTLEGPDHNKTLHRKARENIHTMKELIAKSDTLPLQVTDCMLLRNGFTGTNATSAHQSDLINFRNIGQNDFDAYVEHVYLRTCNTKASVKLNRLTTFSTTSRNVSKQQYARLQAEKKHVTRCFKKRLLYSQMTKDTFPHEQYLELPRAIADVNGIPQKGQKSLTTSFYFKKYGEEVIAPKFPPAWVPHSVILEGMFLINTTPLRIHSCMLEYANFILTRHAGRYLSAGVEEVHLVFDDPGRFDMHPKDIERSRRDTGKQGAVHEHIHFNDKTKVPSKWRNMLDCRKCKRLLPANCPQVPT